MWRIDLYIFFQAEKSLVSILAPMGKVGQSIQDTIDLHPGMSSFVLISIKKT